MHWGVWNRFVSYRFSTVVFCRYLAHTLYSSLLVVVFISISPSHRSHTHTYSMPHGINNNLPMPSDSVYIDITQGHSVSTTKTKNVCSFQFPIYQQHTNDRKTIDFKLLLLFSLSNFATFHMMHLHSTQLFLVFFLRFFADLVSNDRWETCETYVEIIESRWI